MTSLTIIIPHPPLALRPNGRAHRCAVAKAKKKARHNAMILALAELGSAPPPRWKRASLHVCYIYGGRDAAGKLTRQPDADNIIGSLKATIDGARDAGVLFDDKGLDAPTLELVRDPSARPEVRLTFAPEPKP